MKKRIQELIVVEGKNDTNVLQSYFDCDTFETGGDQVTEKTLETIRELRKHRDIIIFTDPDTPGEHIRRLVSQAVPGCKHAFIDKTKARTTKKVGVEHASKEDLWESLSHLVTFDEQKTSLDWQDFIDFGLTGRNDSATLRKRVCDAFYISPCSAKTCFKRLNQMGVTKEQVEEVLYD
ncbi:MAG: ribonuclease M5 [Bacillota bacterium]|nr:ribonuclease M5 [Bacillota bacterium]